MNIKCRLMQGLMVMLSSISLGTFFLCNATYSVGETNAFGQRYLNLPPAGEEEGTKMPEPKVPEPKVPEPSVPEPEVPEPSVPEPEVPEPSVPEPEVPEPSVPEPEVPEPGIPEGTSGDKRG